MENVERWVSSKDVSKHLGINKDALQRWIKNETIPAIELDGCGNLKLVK